MSAELRRIKVYPFSAKLEKEIDMEDGVPTKYINLVLEQVCRTREEVIEMLKETENDMINAVIRFEAEDG